jgi:pre-mRNA-processing factor 39
VLLSDFLILLPKCGISFKQIAHSRPLAELRTAEETAAAAADEAKPAGPVEDVPLPDAEVSAVTEALDGAANLDDKEVESGDSKELEEYLAVRESFYKAAKEWDSKIRDFEIAIRRPYFHVKPLDEAQLGNWHRYLDFIEKEGGFDKVKSFGCNESQSGPLLNWCSLIVLIVLCLGRGV